jgi:hypothetical protein
MLLHPAWLVVAMITSAINAKTLGLNVVFALAMMMFGSSTDAVSLLTLFYVPAVLLASFRD